MTTPFFRSRCIKIFDGSEPRLLADFGCLREDLGNQQVEEVECIVHRRCLQRNGKGDERGQATVLRQALNDGGFCRSCKACQKLNLAERHGARKGDIDAQCAHLINATERAHEFF